MAKILLLISILVSTCCANKVLFAQIDLLMFNEDEALNSLIKKIETDSVYSSWISNECLQFYTIEDTADYVIIDIREKHGNGCPGDTLFAPRVDTFKIHKYNFEIFWYNLFEDKFEPYSVFLGHRKPARL